MNKLIVSLLLLVGPFLANDVSAQMINCGDFYTPWQYTCRNPGPRYSTQNVLNQNQGYNPGYNGGGGSVSIWNQSSEYSNSQYGNRPYPAGGHNNLVIVGYEEGTRPCTQQEEASRRHGYAVFGGVLGAGYGARENRNEAGRLGLIGIGIGELVGIVQSTVSDCTVPVRRPIYAQRQSGNTGYMQQSSYRGQPQTKEVASRCVVNGKVRRGLTEEECDELALTLSKQKTVQTTEKVSVNNTETETKITKKSENSSAMFWGWINPTSSTSNKKPCYASKQISGMPEKCSEIIVESPESGETESVWRKRVAKLGFAGN